MLWQAVLFRHVDELKKRFNKGGGVGWSILIGIVSYIGIVWARIFFFLKKKQLFREAS